MQTETVQHWADYFGAMTDAERYDLSLLSITTGMDHPGFTALHCAYVDSERARYGKAAALRPDDRAGFTQLGLHMLSAQEIADRLTQLDKMESDAVARSPYAFKYRPGDVVQDDLSRRMRITGMSFRSGGVAVYLCRYADLAPNAPEQIADAADVERLTKKTDA